MLFIKNNIIIELFHEKICAISSWRNCPTEGIIKGIVENFQLSGSVEDKNAKILFFFDKFVGTVTGIRNYQIITDFFWH